MLTTPVYRDNAIPEAERVITWLRQKAPFLSVKVGGESFYIAQVPQLFKDQLIRAAAEVLGEDTLSHTLIVGRCSTETIDSEMRVHSDYDMTCTHAWVWYGTDAPTGSVPPVEWGRRLPPSGEVVYGTALYDHVELGPQFSGTHETHNCLLRNESDDPTRWTLRQILPMRKNRLAVYPSDLFHSRYPHAGWGTSQRDGRITIVGFCTAKGHDAKTVDSGCDQETGSTSEESGSKGRQDDSREDAHEGGEGRREIRATGATRQDAQEDVEGLSRDGHVSPELQPR
jgi:hypothetical protein